MTITATLNTGTTKRVAVLPMNEEVAHHTEVYIRWFFSCDCDGCCLMKVWMLNNWKKYFKQNIAGFATSCFYAVTVPPRLLWWCCNKRLLLFVFPSYCMGLKVILCPGLWGAQSLNWENRSSRESCVTWCKVTWMTRRMIAKTLCITSARTWLVECCLPSILICIVVNLVKFCHDADFLQ